MAGYQGRGSKVGNKIVAQSVKEQGGRAAAAKNAAKIAIKAGAFAVNPNKAGKAVNAAKKISKAVSTGKSSSLKKSGIEKLSKIGRSTKESDIIYALKFGKITKQEAAAIDPKNFKILLDTSKTKTIGTLDPKTGKFVKGN